jgi:hypothetical protein
MHLSNVLGDDRAGGLLEWTRLELAQALGARLFCQRLRQRRRAREIPEMTQPTLGAPCRAGA